MKICACFLLGVAAMAAIPAMVRAQGAQYPITVVAPGKGPYTFPAGYQTPWDKIEIMVTAKMSPNLFVLHGSEGLDPAHPDASGGRAMALFGAGWRPDGGYREQTGGREDAEGDPVVHQCAHQGAGQHAYSWRPYRRQRLLRQAGRVDLRAGKSAQSRCCVRRRAPTASRLRRPIWPAFRWRPTATTPPRRASPPSPST